MNVNKLIQCRICLVENVRMYVVANKNLQETYKKLTDVPFVTKDRRPLLACYFCYTKLKQSCRLQRKCLEAEEWFAQALSEDCEVNPQLNQDQLKFSGYVISPIKHVSIYDECEIENVTIKEELPDDCEEQDANVKQKEDYRREHRFQETPLVNVKIEVEEEQNAPTHVSEREDIPPKHSQLQSHYTPVVDLKIEVQDTPAHVSEREDISSKHSEQDPIDFTPFLDLKIEVEEEQGDTSTQFSEPEYIVPQHSMTEFNTEVEQEMPKKRQAETKKRALGTKKQKLDERRAIPEHTVTTQHMGTKQTSSKMIQNTQNPMSEPVTIFIKPFANENPEADCTINNTHMGNYLDNSFSNDFSKKLLSVQLYNCDQCQRSFSELSDFKKHLKEHTSSGEDEEEKPYKCNQCERRFILKKSLRSHIRIHTGEKPFKCEICLRSYSNREDLLQHYRMHRVSRPHRCDYCQRGFRTKHILISHIRVHTGEKPFKCDECQRCFSAASNLTRHMRVHTSEKPHKCDICARSFNEKSHLTRHVRSHTGERPFKCEICRRGFSDKSNMQRHVRRHKGEKSCKIVFKKND